MAALEYMEWSANHNCYLNHTGSPQVYFLQTFLRASHNFLGRGVRGVGGFGKSSYPLWP